MSGSVAIQEMSKRAVLFVDDEERILRSFRRDFSGKFKFYTATSPQLGLKALEDHDEIAVAVVDHRMPEMTGLELVEVGRQLRPDVVWMILSGYASMDLAIKAINEGNVFRFLAKPHPTESLEQEIVAALQQYEYLVGLNRDQSKAGEDLVNSLLEAVTARDMVTGKHSNRMMEISMALADCMGFDSAERERLQALCKLHDIGKIGIPDAVLGKPGFLDEGEMAVMRSHTEIGYRIAIAADALRPIAPLILAHHERWDGTGYPLGLKGEEIPLEVQAMAVADVFDAMTNDRPYRTALEPEIVVEYIMRGSGTQFAPRAVRCFAEFIGKDFPRCMSYLRSD